MNRSKTPTEDTDVVDNSPVNLDTSSEAGLVKSISGKSAENVMKALDDEMDRKILKTQNDAKLAGVNQVERICGPEGKPNGKTCKKGYRLQEVKDLTSPGVSENCCLLDPNRDDMTPEQLNEMINKEIKTSVAFEIAKTAFFVTAQNVLMAPAKVAVKSVAKTSMKIAAKAAVKAKTLAAKAAAKSLAKVATKVATKVAAKAGAKIGAKAAAKAAALAAKAGTGFTFFGPLVMATIVFDVFVAALDYADPGGYGDVALLDEMITMRNKSNELINNTYASLGLPTPKLVGPLDKLPEKNPNPKPDPNKPVTVDEIKALLMQEFAMAYAEEQFHKISDQEKYTDKEREYILQKLAETGEKFFETKEGEEYLEKRTCEYADGVYKNKQCMYKDKESCDKSYNWQKILHAVKNPKKPDDKTPMDPELEYAEWRSVKIRDKTGKEIADSKPEWMCVEADPSLKISCKEDGNNFEYDYEKQVCKIDEIYCRKKGMDPVVTPNGNDCKIGKGQGFAEKIFGTTITRGMIQVFDPKQYKPCKPGEYDVNNVPKEIKIAMAAFPPLAVAYNMLGNKMCVTPSKCPPGKVLETGLCYDKCRDGYKSDGVLRCYKEPPAGWPGTTTITHLQHKTHYSPAKPLDTCNSNEEKSGALCYPKCPNGMRGEGPVCWANTTGIGVGTPVQLESCPPGWNNDGLTCREPIGCCGDRDWFGNCYAWNLCGGKVVGRLNSGGTCPADRHKIDGLCYKRCPPGMDHVPGMPYNCKQAGVPLSQGRGAGTVLKCAPGREQRGALCYDKCDVHNTATVNYERRNDNIEMCSTICPPGSKNIGIGGCQKDAYDRSAGTVPFSVYVKERLVPYGKK